MEEKNHKPHRSTPYQVFLHLMMMTMFYGSVITLIALLVQYINLLFPDQLLSYSESYDIIRSTSSALVITFPVFLLSTWLIRKAFEKNQEERNVFIRRWLIYLTLFVAGITMVVDLVQFVNGFYSGELTLPFFLKLLIILLISLLTFGYFLWDLKENGISSKAAKRMAGISSTGLLFILSVGFILAGSPAEQRAIRLDEQRVMDLQTIEYEIVNYWREKDTLPPSLSDLERDLYYFELPMDPETQMNYEYSITDALSFQLCAHFSADYKPIPNERLPQEQWLHSTGRTCFDREIDPDFYEDDKLKTKLQH